MSVDVNQIITDRVVEMLEAGIVPWRKPWKPGAAHRSVLGHVYRGVNVFLLEMESQAKGYASPFWITYHQAQEWGGTVRKGEKSVIVLFWKRIKVKDKSTGEDKFIPFERYRRVFNVEQTEGVKLPASVANWEPPAAVEGLAAAERIITDYTYNGGPMFIESATNPAFYIPSHDSITVPMKSRFASLPEFYSTAYHEIGHSTGHASRLNRFTDTTFGGHAYGLEELAAEMTATMLCGEAGISDPRMQENSVAYIAGWLHNIREDPRCLVRAAGQAQKAADLVLGRTFEDAEVHSVKEVA